MLLDTTNNLNDIFKILFNNSPLLINCFNNMGKCILWNKSCEKLFGYNLDELNKYSNPLSLFYPDQKQLLLVESEINNPDGNFKNYNIQIKNKTFITCMFANFKLPDNTTLGLGYDVTKIVDLEEELNYNIKLLKSILDSQNDAILRITKDNISIYCNEKYKQTFCINTKLKDLIFEEDIEIYNKIKKSNFINDFRIKIINNQYKWFEVQCTNIIDDENESSEFLYVFRDIQQLKENSNIISNTFNFSLNGICILEMLFNENGEPYNCKYVDVNKSFEKISGLYKYNIVGKTIREVYCCDINNDIEDLLNFLIDTYVNTIPIQTEYHFKQLDKWFNFSIYKLYDNNFVCDIQDITEKKKDELLLRTTLNMDKIANNILVDISLNKDLKNILINICKYSEYYDTDIKTSILFFDQEKQILYQGVSPNLPDDYSYLLEQGLPIGPNVGSCGKCAYTKKLAITEDIQNSPNWIPYKDYIEKTKKYNLNSCWSVPILSSDEKLLGTIANYSSKIGQPNFNNIKILEWSAMIAAVAIEHNLLINKNKESFDQLKVILNNIPLPIIVTDIQDYKVLFLNEANKKNWDIVVGDICYEKLQENQKEPCNHCTANKLLENQKPIGIIRSIAQNSKNKKWYDCYNSAIKWPNDKYVRMEMALDITDLKLSEDLLKVNTEITLLMLKSTDFAATINKILDLVGKTINCSRTYIFEFNQLDILSNKKEDSRLYYSFEWCNNNIEEQISKGYFEEFTLRKIYWERLYDLLNQNKLFNTLIKDLSNIKEKEFLELQKIKSILILPIFLKNNNLYGFIGFDECLYERTWTELEINQLITLTNNIGIFVDKYNSEENVINLCENQSVLLNNLDFYVWYYKDLLTYGFANNLYKDTFLKNKSNLIIDNHNKDEYNRIIKQNQLIYENKEQNIIEDWFIDNNGNNKYLSIRRIPIIKNNKVDSILCIGYNLTEQYIKNDELINTFTKKMNNDFNEIKQLLDKSTNIRRKYDDSVTS